MKRPFLSKILAENGHWLVVEIKCIFFSKLKLMSAFERNLTMDKESDFYRI